MTSSWCHRKSAELFFQLIDNCSKTNMIKRANESRPAGAVLLFRGTGGELFVEPYFFHMQLLRENNYGRPEDL